MKRRIPIWLSWWVALFSLLATGVGPVFAADKLVGIYAARVMSQSLPWIAQEAGLFSKYGLDFELKYIAANAMVTAAMLSGEAELAVVGGEGIEGKKVGVTRIGSNPHYFAIQAFRRFGIDPGKDVTFIQTGGAPETLAALVNGAIDAAVLVAPADAQAIAQGFQYVIYGPDLRIPYAATAFATRRSVIARRPQVVGRFMRAMAEAAKILHTDREVTYRILGRYLGIDDRKVLDAAYNAEIKTLEPRLEIRPEAIQAILEEVAQTDPRAKTIKPQDLVDRRYLEELEKAGFFGS